MSSESFTTDVFISYSRNDKIFVKGLYYALKLCQRSAWVDFNSMPMSPDWWASIQSGIEKADTFIFVISPDSLASHVCHLELEYALSLNKRLLPIWRRQVPHNIDLDVLDSKSPGDYTRQLIGQRKIREIAQQNWIELNRPNWTYMRVKQDNFRKGFMSLVEALDLDINHTQEHTKLLIRAGEWQNSKKRASYLLRDNQLEDAEIWLARGASTEPRPTPLHTEYILASRQDATRRQRRLTVIAIIVAVVTMLLAIAAGLGFQSSQSNLQLANQNATGIAFQAGIALANADLAGTQAKRADTNAATSDANAVIAQDNAASATFAQGKALDNAATSDANASTAIAAQSTAQRRADEALSRDIVPVVGTAISNFDYVQAVAMAMVANRIPKPPAASQQVLADVAYLPGPRRAFEQRHFAGIIDVAVSPDGVYAVSGSYDQLVIIWEVATGKAVRYLGGHESLVQRVLFSSDGQYIYSAGCNLACTQGDIIQWNAATGEMVNRYRGHTNLVWDMALSRDGQWLLSGDIDGSVILWETRTSKLRTEIYTGAETLHSVAISAVGREAIVSTCHVRADVGCDTAKIAIWDLPSGELIRERTFDQLDIRHLILLANRNIVTVNDFKAEILNFQLETIQEFDVSDFPGMVRVSPNEQYLVVTRLNGSNNDAPILVYDLKTGELLIGFSQWYNLGRVETLSASPGAVTWLPNNIQLLTGGNVVSPELMLWDLTVPLRLARTNSPFNGITRLALSPNNELVAVYGFYSTSNYGVAVLDGNLKLLYELKGDVKDITFSPDNQYLITTSARGIQYWDTLTGVEKRRIGQPPRLVAQFIFPESHLAVAHGCLGAWITDCTTGVIVWDSETQRILHRFAVFKAEVADADLSDDGRYLLVSGYEEKEFLTAPAARIVVFDVITGDIVVDRTFEALDKIIEGLDADTVEISPDGHSAVIGFSDDTLQVWDLPSGSIRLTLRGHHNDVMRAHFTTDSRYIVSVGCGEEDAFDCLQAQLMTWDAETGELINQRVVESEMPFDLVLTADMSAAVLGNFNGEILVVLLDRADTLIPWITQNRFVRELTCEERDQFYVEPQCDEQNVFPTSTLVIPPTPSPTAVSRQVIVSGEYNGALMLGNRESWIYEGQADEVLTVEVRAENPANGALPYVQLRDSRLDTRLVIYDPSGNVLAENDDLFSPVFTNSMIFGLPLPVNGTYVIEVSSPVIDASGNYLLIVHSDRQTDQ